jgi:hypothetical protein
MDAYTQELLKAIHTLRKDKKNKESKGQIPE